MSHLARTRTALALLFTFAVLVVLVLGCGGGGGTAPTSSRDAQKSGRALTAEKSIEGFGEEAAGAARKAILVTERSYFGAIASKRYSIACSYLASSVKRSVVELAGANRHVFCPEVLAALLTPEASSTARQETHGAIKRVRIESGRAFIVFHTSGARLFQLPLVAEKGRWKVELLTASVLAPSASTLTQ